MFPLDPLLRVVAWDGTEVGVEEMVVAGGGGGGGGGGGVSSSLDLQLTNRSTGQQEL